MNLMGELVRFCFSDVKTPDPGDHIISNVNDDVKLLFNYICISVVCHMLYLGRIVDGLGSSGRA